MAWKEFIEQPRDVLGGKPVIKGTRISVETLLERLGDGWSDADIVQAFPGRTPNHIRAAQAYAAAALAADELIFLTEPAA